MTVYIGHNFPMQAGIPKDQLILSLEPEAASIYCQYLPTTKLAGSEGFVMSKIGTTYMVVDLGGTFYTYRSRSQKVVGDLRHSEKGYFVCEILIFH